MTALAAPRRYARLPVPVLVAGFTAAVSLRVVVGRPAVATSAAAGLLFALALAGLTVAAGTRTRVSGRAVTAGLAAAVVLCLPPAVHAIAAGRLMPAAGFGRWAVVVTAVAVAEEAFLRGALYDAVAERASVEVAVLAAAMCFAALHVPLYGWRVAPLDLAVGLVLGVVRMACGSWTGPAVTHVTADLVAWFLR